MNATLAELLIGVIGRGRSLLAVVLGRGRAAATTGSRPAAVSTAPPGPARAASRHRASRAPARRARGAARRRAAAPRRAHPPARRRRGRPRGPEGRAAGHRGRPPGRARAVAGLTAEDARAELMAAVEHEARRSAALMPPATSSRLATDEAETKAKQVLATAIQRLAAEQTSESVGRRRAPAHRRHEGPDHRPRGPQHPRLRADHRRQRRHRRHPRDRAAQLLRPGAARGRPG